MYVKENLYYCWDDHDFMTRDGGTYTKKEIIEGRLEHCVLTDGDTEKVPDGKWRVQIHINTAVFETKGGEYVVTDIWGDIEQLRKDQVSLQYGEKE